MRCQWQALALALTLATARAGGAEVTPVEKVITLLEDLLTEVEADGKSEAKTYDEFACFCKDTTMKKSDSIKEGQDNIKSLSAEIQEKTAEGEAAQAEKEERAAKKEKLAAELADQKALFAKEQAVYEEFTTELAKNIIAVEKAIKALEDSKPTAGASLLQSVRDTVQHSLDLADALGFLDSVQRRTVGALLQVDPKDPEYKFHSQPIIDVLQKLLEDIRTKKSEVDAEWEKTKKNYEDKIADLTSQLDEEGKAILALEEKIERLKGEVATARESLVNAEFNLKEDQLYLKDLTARCEDRANDWDQRTQVRAGEVEAITKALEILKGTVQGLDEDVNKRALLLQQRQQQPAHTTPQAEASFLQLDSPRARVRSLLERARATAAAPSEEAKARALELLASEGHRLQSTVLLSLAARSSKDPFTKIKKIIQQLIERLLREANAEATKKGFCDTELGKAEQDRDFRFADVKKLNNELEVLEVKLAELTQEAEMMGEDMTEISEALGKATKLRGDEKAENVEDLAKAKEGLEAVTEAIVILKSYYKQAAKGKVLLQASPVDEDTEGAGFAGEYKGKQESSKSIIGLLEVIKSDFERTLRKTEAAEKKAAAEFVEFDRTSKSDYAGKNMTKTLDEQDAKTTKSTIGTKMDDLQTAQNLLDKALEELEELKPTCIDTGMSYEERVAKREEEMEALKKALCILDTEKVEEGC